MAATAEASSSSLTFTSDVAVNNETLPASTTAIIDLEGKDAGDKGLKKTWLNLLPVERVIEIVLKLDEHASPEMKREIWPTDLKASVFNAAVATIIESSNKGKAFDLAGLVSGALSSPKPESVAEKEAAATPATARDASPSTDVEDTPPVMKASEVASTSQMQVPPMSAASTSTSASTSTAPPATSMTPYGSSYPFQYAYSHPLHQAYPYVYSTPPTSGPTPYSPAPPSTSTGAHSKARAEDRSEEEDLPSYEEMLVQALLEHTEPGGIAPKQLFQWMAAHYPLQANFRPSASQALQKAYKRGRLEKNKDGKYRLNPTWEGGNTSKRTTRRPQSYAKAVTNPSPSSHPPAIAYPPLPWYSASNAPVRDSPAAQQQDAKTAISAPGPDSTIPDAESHRDAWEAAQSILQALNFGAVLDPALDGVKQVDAAALAKPVTGSVSSDLGGSSGLELPSSEPAASISGGSGSLAPSVVEFALPSAGIKSTHPAAAQSAPSTDRLALQRSLALLAAQLADLAAEDIGSESTVTTMAPVLTTTEWPTLTEALSLSTNSNDMADG